MEEVEGGERPCEEEADHHHDDRDDVGEGHIAHPLGGCRHGDEDDDDHDQDDENLQVRPDCRNHPHPGSKP